MNYKSIIELILKKDQKGLEALYNQYGKKFYGFAIEKWHLSEDQAWDVIYQTLYTLTLKLSDYNFESQAHFNNLIFKIFVNFLRQSFRASRKNTSEIVFTDFNMNQFTDESEFNEASDNIEITDFDKQTLNAYYTSEVIENPKLVAINEALKEMESLDKDLLIMRAQNFTYEEIAKMLRIDNNQLKVRYFRAKKKLIHLFFEKLNH